MTAQRDMSKTLHKNDASSSDYFHFSGTVFSALAFCVVQTAGHAPASKKCFLGRRITNCSEEETAETSSISLVRKGLTSTPLPPFLQLPAPASCAFDHQLRRSFFTAANSYRMHLRSRQRHQTPSKYSGIFIVLTNAIVTI